MDKVDDKLSSLNLGEDVTRTVRTLLPVLIQRHRIPEQVSRVDRSLSFPLVSHTKVPDGDDHNVFHSQPARRVNVTNYGQPYYDLSAPRASTATYRDYNHPRSSNVSTQSSSSLRTASEAGSSRSSHTSVSVSTYGRSITGRRNSDIKFGALPTRLPEKLHEMVECHNLAWLHLKAFLERRFPGVFFEMHSVVQANNYIFNVPEKLTLEDRENIETLRSNVSSVSPPRRDSSSTRAFTSFKSLKEYNLHSLLPDVQVSPVNPTNDVPIIGLPCEFTYAGCVRRFNNADVEGWIAHSLTHFEDAGPPIYASCTICELIPFTNDIIPFDDWRIRMLHVHAHLAAGECRMMQPDIWVVEHLRKHNLTSKGEYALGIRYPSHMSNTMLYREFQLGEQASIEGKPGKLDDSIGGAGDSDSTSSSDKTDWDDVSDLDYQSRDTYEDDVSSKLISLEKSMAQARCQMTKRLMDEFWIIFYHSWEGKYKSCAETSVPQVTGRAPDTTDSHTGADKLSKGTKRRRRGSSDEDDVNKDRQAPKRTDDLPPLPEEAKAAYSFACPFRKNNPRKYNVSVPSWKSCALTPHKTVARVKAHLYKYHLIYQCARCKRLFANDDELERHSINIAGCEVKAGTQVDGITRKMEEKLHSRKKAFKGQTEEQRWDQIFDILFPYHTGTKPTPYFEPVKDGEEQETPSAESPHFATFENFLRRELPKIFENALVCKLDAEMHPMEEKLRAQFPDLIREATDVAFSKYRAMHYADAEWNLDPAGYKADILHQVEPSFESHSSFNRLAGLEPVREEGAFLDAEFVSTSTTNSATKPLKDFDVSHVPSAWKGKGKEIFVDDSNHEENRITINPYDIIVDPWGSQLNPVSGKIISTALDPQNWLEITTDAVLGDYDLDMYLYTCSNSDDLYGA